VELGLLEGGVDDGVGPPRGLAAIAAERICAGAALQLLLLDAPLDENCGSLILPRGSLGKEDGPMRSDAVVLALALLCPLSLCLVSFLCS
jgi:hypothetical protein